MKNYKKIHAEILNSSRKTFKIEKMINHQKIDGNKHKIPERN